MTQPTPGPTWSQPTVEPQPTPKPVVVRPRTTFKLVLDDARYGGLQIRVRSQSFLEWTDAERDISWPGNDAPGQAKNAYYRRMCENFASYIVEWNLTDESGRDEPVSTEALMGLDRQIVLDLFGAWNDAQTGKVDAPLDEPSVSGQPSLEAQIPMETASPSLAS